jgi:DNA-binding transcriptional LysR family regulator
MPMSSAPLSLRGEVDQLPLRLKLLSYFAVAASEGSFDAAAQRLDVSKTLLTDQVARLEKLAGTCLLERSGPHIAPTQQGRRLFDECAGILNAVSQAFERLERTGVGPAGYLRVNATLDYGSSVIAPKLALYAALYPSVRVELHLSEKFVELGGTGYDIALQLGPDGSGLPSRRIGSFENWLVAAPSMAQTIGELRRPQDLQSVPWVGDVTLSNINGWHFSHASEGAYTMHATPAITIRASCAIRACLLAGTGVGVLPDYLAADDVQDGRLIRLLPAWSLPRGEVHAVFSLGRSNTVAAEALADLLSGGAA